MVLKQCIRVAERKRNEESKEEWKKFAYVSWSMHRHSPATYHYSLHEWFDMLDLNDKPLRTNSKESIQEEITSAYANAAKVREAFNSRGVKRI